MSEVKKLPKIIKHCMTIGEIPTSYKVSLTYEEQLLWFCKFLQDEVIPVVNNNSEVVEELKNWFENLDVQEEINNKLDEMAESGELERIIAQYLQLNGVLSFNTKNDMINSSYIVEGSTCRTLGLDSYNDGKGRLYKIEKITSATGVDGINLINIGRDNLYARLIDEEYIHQINDVVEDLGETNLNVQQITTNIGNLQNLTTSQKNNLVNAINSINLMNVDESQFPTGTKFHIIAGAIRQNESDVNQWFFISDTNHQPVGLDTIEIDRNLYLKFSYKQHFDKVISIIVTPDETLASMNVTAGCSVGNDYSLIGIGCKYSQEGTVYYDGTNWVDSLGGTVSMASNGVITLTPSSSLNLFTPYGVECETISRGYASLVNVVRLETGIRFMAFDGSGNKLTTPTQEIAFKYRFTNNGYIRPNSKMPGGSNFWIFGIMAQYPTT